MDVTFLTNVIRHILERDNFVIDFEESDEQNIHFWHRDEPFRLFISEQTENYLVWTVFENGFIKTEAKQGIAFVVFKPLEMRILPMLMISSKTFI